MCGARTDNGPKRHTLKGVGLCIVQVHIDCSVSIWELVVFSQHHYVFVMCSKDGCDILIGYVV